MTTAASCQGAARGDERGHSASATDRWKPAARFARTVALMPLLAYSKLISPALPRRCRYEPTCSAYAIEAVRQFGILRGSMLGAWRLLRCNPFSDGGYDPVAAQRLFKPDR
jgi:uncharacterized protein